MLVKGEKPQGKALVWCRMSQARVSTPAPAARQTSAVLRRAAPLRRLRKTLMTGSSKRRAKLAPIPREAPQ
jgi:hypothetical protein